MNSFVSNSFGSEYIPVRMVFADYVSREKLFISSGIVFLCDFVFPLAVGIPLSRVIRINGLWIGLACAPVIMLVVAGLIVGFVYGIKQLPLLLNSEDGIADTYS